MIRTAFIGVLVLGLAIAAAAFFLARGTEGDVPQITVEDGQTTTSPPPATPDVDKLYYLREIDFDQGDIVVMLWVDNANDPLIIRDQEALRAAAPSAYVNTSSTGGQDLGSFALAMLGAPPTETIVKVFRNDLMIAAVSCTNTACGSFASDPDVDHAGLEDHATPHSAVYDRFDDYQTYLDTVLAISEDPDFMFLDARPRQDFPAPRRLASLTLNLPTVVHQIGEPFDPLAHRDRIRDALAPLVPPEATITDVTVTNMGKAVVADMDNGQPVTAGGMPIPFPYADFYLSRVTITGIDRLPQSDLDRLAEATAVDFNVDNRFEDFVRSRLQNDCVDCFFLKVDGPFQNRVTIHRMNPESYYLDYYDLRDAP